MGRRRARYGAPAGGRGRLRPAGRRWSNRAPRRPIPTSGPVGPKPIGKFP